LHREALALSREVDDRLNSAWALVFLGGQLTGYPDADYEVGIALCEEGLALFRELDLKPAIARALNVLGELARLDGDYERAREVYEEGLAIARETGDRHREALMLGNLGYVAQYQGDYERAEALAMEALNLLWERRLDYHVPMGMAMLAGPVGAKGDAARAARLLGAAEALPEAMGVGLQPADQLEADRYVAAVRKQLDGAAFEAARAEGRAMSLEEAVAYALGEDAK
jgi:tetratricopeptide (TPR) repeat protein